MEQRRTDVFNVTACDLLVVSVTCVSTATRVLSASDNLQGCQEKGIFPDGKEMFYEFHRGAYVRRRGLLRRLEELTIRHPTGQIHSPLPRSASVAGRLQNADCVTLPNDRGVAGRGLPLERGATTGVGRRALTNCCGGAGAHHSRHHLHCPTKTSMVFLFALLAQDGDYVWHDVVKLAVADQTQAAISPSPPAPDFLGPMFQQSFGAAKDAQGAARLPGPCSSLTRRQIGERIRQSILITVPDLPLWRGGRGHRAPGFGRSNHSCAFPTQGKSAITLVLGISASPTTARHARSCCSRCARGRATATYYGRRWSSLRSVLTQLHYSANEEPSELWWTRWRTFHRQRSRCCTTVYMQGAKKWQRLQLHEPLLCSRQAGRLCPPKSAATMAECHDGDFLWTEVRHLLQALLRRDTRRWASRRKGRGISRRYGVRCSMVLWLHVINIR